MIEADAGPYQVEEAPKRTLLPRGSGRASVGATTAGVSLAVALFALSCRAVGTRLPVNEALLVVAGLLGALVGLGILGWHSVKSASGADAIARTLSATALTGAVWFLFIGVIYKLSFLLALRVDLLSYSEGGFLNDVVRMHLGLPIYAPALDNQSTVYTPGSQLLTAWIAELFGDPLDVPTLRLAQFTYVVAAAAAAAAAADRLARLIGRERYRQPWLWVAWWFPLFVMVATEPRFNAYTPSLNSDGLALAISMLGFLSMAQHALAPKRWHLVVMVVLPAAGFFVKQNLLAWVGVFGLYLLVGSGVTTAFLYGAAAGLLGLVSIGSAYLLWGSDFWFWAITSYGPKVVSVPRSFQHLLSGGIYLAIGTGMGWFLLRRWLARTDRRAFAIWLSWLALMLLQAYTSGFAWALNHLGPSVLMASVWLAVLVVVLWPERREYSDAWRFVAAQALSVGMVCAILGGLNFPREPRNPVPRDVERYATAIEHEFAGHDPSRILMDQGTWIYAQNGVAMNDRGFATHVHLEPNQPIAHGMLAGTIGRIARQEYEKILVRELDEGRSSYDFQNRGSGIREAIHANYVEVRRIPGVAGVQQWWPPHMLDAIQVFERRTQ